MSRSGACRAVLVVAVMMNAGAGRAIAAVPPKIVDLGAFLGFSTTARGINDAGVIVGERYRNVDETRNESHGLIWRKDASGQYFAAELDALTDFPNSYPRSINNSGRIGGWAEVVDLSVWGPPAQAVMWEVDGFGAYVPTDLGTPYGFWYSETAFANDGGHVLNELGQIVGGAQSLPSWEYHAYLWAEPGFSPPIDLSPSAGSDPFKAYGVNNSGFAVGANVRLGKAILWLRDDAGNYSHRELPMLAGGRRATAHDINDLGQIVGMVDTRAVIWDTDASGDYAARALDLPPGGTSSRALAINNSGDVIGWAVANVAGTVGHHAVVWQRDSSGQYSPLLLAAVPGITGSDAYGINDRGQIVGSATYSDGQTGARHAVLWEMADVTPPTIASPSVSPEQLWPPNHELVDVVIGYEATDDSASVTCQLGPVTCNEPFGLADWQVLDDHRLRLRSERNGDGHDRVYTIQIVCSDVSGNVDSLPVVVTVPHDQRK